ncbi:MAG: coiled-coil domain-containing protein mad1 [Chrysothrix sp. TS-e1954]|nr:MAG: coiled-coil domain-containing protein mad1 [Chrysothrix sp. TS-e1954]
MAPARHQPQYDFLTGGEQQADPSLRQTFGASVPIKPDEDNENLRTEIHKLRYELDSIKQERELTDVRQEEELRSARSKADADYKRAQASESAKHLATSKLEALSRESREAREGHNEEKSDLERRLRTEQDRAQTLEEEVQEAHEETASQERQFKHDLNELKTKHDSTQRTAEDLRIDYEEKTKALQTTQQRLTAREEEVGKFENEILRLKAQSGDSDTFNVIKQELSEQVAHIQKLESLNNDQRTELKKYRQQQKAIDVVEEEKRNLENRVHILGDLRKQLREAQLQRQILEDERKTWTSYLEKLAADDEAAKFDTPKDLAKAFTQQRLEVLSLTEQLGEVKPDLSAKDGIIQELETQLSTTRGELETARTSTSGGDAKAKARLERQRALAVKEVDYLRAQLKAFDAEEGEFRPESYDAQKTTRIQELEDVIDKHRTEIHALHRELFFQASRTTSNDDASPSKAGTKRPRSSSPSAPDTASPETSTRIGELIRKNRTLQDELSSLSTARALLEQETSALSSQLSSLKSSNRTRILEFRENPTATAAKIKQTTLDTLRTENAALLSQLEELQNTQPATNGTTSKPKTRSSKHPAPDEPRRDLIPRASLDRLRHDLDSKTTALASAEKHTLRLKQIFAAKSREFREAVASILGWKLDFLPNGRVRVTSMFYPSADGGAGGADDGGGDDADEESNSIVFDGEQGTMKVSGGPNSKFAGEIRGLIEFWVEGKKEIPCFLAGATLEFFERTTRAMKM